MYLEDIISAIKTLLSSPNWTAGTQPFIDKWTETNTLELNNNDTVLIKVPNEDIKGFGLHGNDWLHNLPIIIRVNSATSQVRTTAIVNEILRILGNNVRLANYIDLLFDGIVDNSYEMRNMWEYQLMFRTRRNDTVA